MWAPIVLFLSGFAILGWQAVTWLKTGISPELPVAALFTYPGLQIKATGWVGIDRMIEAVMQWPLSFTLVVLSFVVGFFSSDRR